MPDIEIAEEVVPRRTFVWAIDWPGWCRSGKTADLARASLVAAAPRYAVVARTAGLVLPEVTEAHLRTIESVAGDGGTEFGVPSAIVAADRLPTTSADAERLAGLVAAAWMVLDQVAAAAPPILRKGPRGGGRDRDRVIEHVVGADHAYARTIGITLRPSSATDGPAVEAERTAILRVLEEPSDGSPLAGRTWPVRYAARRIAWHALDHAWEIEDRTEPEPG